MERLSVRERRLAQLVSLPVAAAQAYHLVMGETPAPRTASRMDEALNEVGHSLAILITIYAAGESGPCALNEIQVLNGRFERACTALVMEDGRTFRDLSVRRGDLREAVRILRSANVRFGGGR